MKRKKKPQIEIPISITYSLSGANPSKGLHLDKRKERKDLRNEKKKERIRNEKKERKDKE